MTEPRRRHAWARIAEHADDPLAWWRSVVGRIATSTFLRGEKSEWRADPDWMLLPANLVKVEEGKYDDRPGLQAKTTGSRRIAAEDIDWSSKPVGDVTNEF